MGLSEAAATEHLNALGVTNVRWAADGGDGDRRRGLAFEGRFQGKIVRYGALCPRLSVGDADGLARLNIVSSYRMRLYDYVA
jgi:hypothetical protein